MRQVGPSDAFCDNFRVQTDLKMKDWISFISCTMYNITHSRTVISSWSTSISKDPWRSRALPRTSCQQQPLKNTHLQLQRSALVAGKQHPGHLQKKLLVAEVLLSCSIIHAVPLQGFECCSLPSESTRWQCFTLLFLAECLVVCVSGRLECLKLKSWFVQ